MTTSPPRRRRWLLSTLLTLGALVVVFFIASVAFLASESGLPFIVARVVAQSGGRLSVDGVSGSVASTMRFARVTWNGGESTLTATDVVVEWQPFALLSSRVAIRGVGAGRIVLLVKPSTTPTTPPESLALPLSVDIERADVATFEWQVGPRTGTITGIEFGYRGGPASHAVDNVRFVSEFGTLTGNATIAALAPFAIGGDLAMTGAGPIDGSTARAKVSGTLASLDVDANGAYRNATFAAKVDVAPFDAHAFRSATLAVADVDLAALDPSLPITRLALNGDARPDGDGFAGAFAATNAEAGTIDASRWPLTAAKGRYRYARDAVALSDLDIDIAGGGHASGDARVQVAPDAPSRWNLAIRDLDLAQLHSSLTRTRLAGTIKAEVEGSRQTIEADVTERSLSLAFTAVYAERRLDVSRFRAQGYGGSLSGKGTIRIDAPRPFDVSLEARRFDPARFASVPSGSLDGTIKASGTLVPEWNAKADVTIAKGSRYAGVAVNGFARGSVTRRTLAQASIDLTAGTAHFVASGNAGAPGDRLAVALDAPRLADLAALIPGSALKPLEGKVNAKGTLALEPGGIGGDADIDAGALRVGSILSTDKLTVHASFAPGGAANRPVPLAARPLSLTATATKLTVEQMTFSTARVQMQGTLAEHTATLSARGEDIDATLSIAGGITEIERDVEAARWSGTIASFNNGGNVSVKLTQPATLELARKRVRLGNARITIANGYAQIDDLLYDAGRITSHGTFNDVALASVATLAGHPPPFKSTLTLNGDWSISASPQLSGTFNVRRGAGDVYAIQSDPAGTADVGIGIETLELAGTLRDDALDAKLAFRSQRAGTLQGAVSVGTVAGAPPGRIARNAPLKATLDADLASLAPLQPWLGTTAVLNGRIRINAAASGTLDAPRIAGDISGDGIRVDAPQYGIALRDGLVRAHLVDRAIVVDEISLVGGDGKFTASGTIAPRTADAGPGTRIAWRAENFRIANRPDLRLVVAGNGSLRVVDKKLALDGRIDVVEGQIEYEPLPAGELGPDVVVVGRMTRIERDERSRDLPLILDVNVDFGNRLTFEGSGLQASLTGSVRVKTSPTGFLTGEGTIATASGTYYAFGQKLSIERGRLTFDGPLDNPALDVVALRKNLAVEAGVEVTGTVKVPRVRITSNPPVPENEALSWLITGEPLSTGSRSDYAALAAASASLLSGKGKPLSTEIAQRLGLDDISVRSGGIGNANANAQGTAGQVVVLGKRISDRLTVGYEQGLSIAANAVRLEYALTNTLTVRAEAGTVSGVGLYYRRTYN